MNKRILLASIITMLSAPASSQGIGFPGAIPPTIDLQAAQYCIPSDIAKDAEIVTIAVGRPSRTPLMMQIGQRTGSAAQLVTIKGGSGAPTILHLVSQGSVVWDLREIPEGRIKAVMLYGDAPMGLSGLAGLPKDVPVEYGMNTNGGYGAREMECLKPAASADANTLPLLSKTMNIRFGKLPTRMFASVSGDSFDIDKGIVEPGEAKAPEANEVKSLFPVTPLNILPGREGIQQLVSQGKLKPFTSQDVQAWKNAGATLTNTAKVEDRMPQIPENLSDEMKKRIRDSLEQQARNMNINSGYLATTNLTLPSGFQPSPSSAIVLAPGVNVEMSGDNRIGFSPMIFRISGIDVEKIQTTGTQADTRMLEEQIRRGNRNPDFHAYWNKDRIELEFPGIEIKSTEDDSGESSPWAWIIAGIFGVVATALGITLAIVLRRR